MSEFNMRLSAAVVLAALGLVALFTYLCFESEDRTIRRMKRKIKRALAISLGIAVAFAGSLAVGHMVGTIGATENNHAVTESGTSPIYLILGFLVVLAIAGFVGLAIAACLNLQNVRSRGAHA